MERGKLVEFYKKYNLTPKDVYKHNHYTIVTRSGIEKISAQEDITVRYEDKILTSDYAVIKAYATKGDKTVETYGSAKQGSGGGGNTPSWYVAELAEKRSFSRAVLKLLGLYEHGVFGQEEAEAFKEKTADIE